MMTPNLQSIDGKRARMARDARLRRPVRGGGVNSRGNAAGAIVGALYAIPDDRPQTMRRLSFCLNENNHDN